MEARANRATLVLVAVTLLCSPACHPARKQPLPDKIPTPPNLQFTGREEGWPPRPAARSDPVAVPWSPRVGTLAEALEAELRQTATRDQRVREVLGDRFGYVTAAAIESTKEAPPSRSEAQAVRLTFYSYTNNVAVEVLMQGQVVKSVVRRPNYQPPEGAEEIEMAIGLARKDSRLREAVQDMRATAILTYPAEGQRGYGHRVLHVSFSVGGEEVPRYYTLVDLTDQKLVFAGRVGER